MEIENLKDLSASDFIKHLRKEIAEECRGSIQKAIIHKCLPMINSIELMDEIMKIIRGDK